MHWTSEFNTKQRNKLQPLIAKTIQQVLHIVPLNQREELRILQNSCSTATLTIPSEQPRNIHNAPFHSSVHQTGQTPHAALVLKMASQHKVFPDEQWRPPISAPPQNKVFFLLLLLVAKQGSVFHRSQHGEGEVPVCLLGVEGKNTLLVSSQQQEGWHASRQCVDPRHVQARWTGSLARHRKCPERERDKNIIPKCEQQTIKDWHSHPRFHLHHIPKT